MSSPSPAGMQAYFYEDEVYRIGSRGQVHFGLVVDNCEASSSSGSEAEAPLQRGDLRVVWHPAAAERVVSERAVGLADRALMPGDVVRRMIKGKDTQRGYCRDLSVTGAVQIVGTNLVLPAVPSERLQPLEDFTADLAVCLDSWVGTSKSVHSKLRLVSNDGSKLEYPDATMCLLEDFTQRRRRRGLGPGWIDHHNNEYYPGQTVIGPVNYLDNVVWRHITKEMEAALKHRTREHKFTVESVETESVGVHWQCRALGEQAGSGPPVQPRFLVEGEDLKRLKLLNLFEPCTLQVGAKNFLTITADDTFCTKAQWKKTQNKIYRELRRQTRPPKPNKIKDVEVKDSTNVAQADLNLTHSHTFRIPGKSKKRPSAFREVKMYYYNIQAQQAQEKAFVTSSGKDCTTESFNKNDENVVLKMDVDIIVKDNDQVSGAVSKTNSIENNDNIDKNSISNQNEVAENKGITSIVPPKLEEGCHLDVPDRNCNGKCTSSDRSCSPDCIDISDRQKKLRKSKMHGKGRSRSNSPALINGDHKFELHPEIDDSDSWANTSSDEGTDTDSCATWSSQCSSSTNNSMASGRGKKSPHLVTKFLKGKRLKKTSKRSSSVPAPKPDDRVVVETLCTKSKANVVWQDGTIEFGIPSTDLYPIHHLDGQECFPGDFVVSGGSTEVSPSHRDYGVVQKVDHYGRTAIVKWFRTYTSCQEPVPQFISESEVSVYDLKDHPDFQYRPGTVVIRVANFTGSESTCTAGQVMDNFPSGRVHVWWVDGHKSMCWPQDLYKVGEYDSDEGDIWADEGSGSEDSWETQSSISDSGVDSKDKKNLEKIDESMENDILLPETKDEANSANNQTKDLPKVPRGLEPRAAAHIERGLNAMARMEEILSQNPSLQSHEIMRKLLALYKDCRFLDRLMGTSFFHEDHFQGLIERVRERGGSRENTSGGAGVRRVQNQVMRLFSRDDSDGPEIPASVTSSIITIDQHNIQHSINSKTITNITNIPHVEIDSSNSSIKDSCVESSDMDYLELNSKNIKLCSTAVDMKSCLKEPLLDVHMRSPSSDESLSKYNTPVGSIGDLTNQSDKSLNQVIERNKNEDSGIDSQSISISQSVNNTAISGSCEESIFVENEMADTGMQVKQLDEVKSKTDAACSTMDTSLSNRNVCLKLCSLITIQLMKACAEVSRRRSSLFVPFLNKLMKEKVTREDPLPYHFSVQFDALVVTMTDEKEENKEMMEVDENIETHDFKDVKDNVKESNVGNDVPATINTVVIEFGEGFSMLESAPNTHRFRLSLLQPSEPRAFHQAVTREIRLLKSDLPSGVWVRGYEERMDLLSIMIAGPAKTPYEDGLFLFDVQLGGEYPRAPPLCHYLSFCSDRLNPNLYEDGKVCVSLLGTWSGRGVEVWGKDSSLLQVIVSLQGLILCAEPYFNEAGFEKQKGSQQGNENSRMYNEMVLLKLVQSLTKMVLHPPEVFKKEIFAHQSKHASGLCDRLTRWMVMSEEYNSQHVETPLTPDTIKTAADKFALQPPEYPLIPASRGFCLTLRSSLESYRNALSKVGISFEKTL